MMRAILLICCVLMVSCTSHDIWMRPGVQEGPTTTTPGRIQVLTEAPDGATELADLRYEQPVLTTYTFAEENIRWMASSIGADAVVIPDRDTMAMIGETRSLTAVAIRSHTPKNNGPDQ